MIRRMFLGVFAAVVTGALGHMAYAADMTPPARLADERKTKLLGWINTVLEARKDKGVVEGRKYKAVSVRLLEVYRVGEPGQPPAEVGYQFTYALEPDRGGQTAWKFIGGTPFTWRPGMGDKDFEQFQLRYSGWDPELTLVLEKVDLGKK